MELRIALDLPEGFRPKAKYALRVLLAPYQIQPVWSDAETVAAQGGLYYGFSPLPFRSAEAPVLCLCSHPETWAYFEKREDLDPTAVFEWPDATGAHDAFPVLFGQPVVEQPSSPVRWVQADIVASAFFWLSDWQHHTRTHKDAHGRQPFAGSLQEHLHLHTRALVDEYGSLLADLLRQQGFAVEGRHATGDWWAVFSHDLDRIRKKSPGIAVRETFDFLLMNKRREALGRRLRRWGSAMGQWAFGDDAYEASILRLFREERERGIRGVYLFKSVLNRHVNDARDYLSYPFLDRILAEIRQNSAEMGYHSGYEAGSAPSQLRAEMGRLSNRAGAELRCHRSHYLRYDPTVTFPQIEELGMTVDSSVAWAEVSGFRAQTSRPYPIFDIGTNRPLKVLEVPLAVMDTQLFGYQKFGPDEAISQSDEVLHTAKRHGGVIVWNFHHHIHDPIDAPGWGRLVESAYERSADRAVTFSDLHKMYAPVYANME